MPIDSVATLLRLLGEFRLLEPAQLDEAARALQPPFRAAGKLTHPNIICAFDADCVGQTHFFTMEYIEGADLARVVKERGPLPVGEACDYIRQAALGLQHAFEQGLVHRDLKPANLLL